MSKAAAALTSLPSNIDCNWRHGTGIKRTCLIEYDKFYVPIILFKQKVVFYPRESRYKFILASVQAQELSLLEDNAIT